MLNLVIDRRIEEAADIVSLELVDPGGAALPPFSAGSHIDVELETRLVRQYSLCNNAVERHRYQIAILKDPASRGGSIAMHMLREGQVVRVSEPRNHFALEHGAPRTLLFAGGIGITPILCMAERLAAIDAPFEMHYSARSRAACAFHDRIRASSFAGQAHLHFDDDPSRKLDIVTALASPVADAHVYVCGPGGYIDFVLSSARAQGFAEAQLHREYFGAGTVVDPSDDDAFEVKIASTGQVFRIPPDASILQVLAGNGIELPASCEQGVCGTCLTRVIEGTPDHRDMFLMENEKAANDQILPCCSRSLSPLLVLDI